MAVDRIGVLLYPVSVTPVSGVAKTRLMQRIVLLEREIEHMRTAVRDMRNGANMDDSRLLTSGVMNSRNWTLSAVMSHFYIQSLLGGNAGHSTPGFATTAPWFQADLLPSRAGKAGAQDGLRARVG